MKTRGIGVRVLTFAGVTVLISGLWLLASFRGSGKSDREAGVRTSAAALSGAFNSARTKQDPKWAEAYGRLPLSFEENVGQTAQEVRYVSHGSGYELFLTPQEAVLGLRTPVTYDWSPLHRHETLKAIHAAARARTMTAIRMQFEGANPGAQISATDRLAKRTSYFIGSDPRKWHTDIRSFARVKYTNIYPGVDLVFYGNHGKLEYDFVVAPGADPKAIRLRLDGARRVRIGARGEVLLGLPGGEVTLQKPLVYQVVKGERHEIAGNYVLGKDHKVGFSIGSYDRNKPLILDPVLNYSTYLGGTADDGGAPGMGIAVDSAGNAYVTGITFSTDFPTTAANAENPGPLAINPAGAAFVTEMNPTGTAEIYSTYLTGTTGAITGALGTAIAVDSTGKIYVTGQVYSPDFPTTTNALKQSPNAPDTIGTSFISKIDPTLSGAASLIYSSYIGGTDTTGAFGDFGNGIAADGSGNAYVVGITYSTPGGALANFPVTAGAFQSTLNTVNGNAFLTRIDTTKSGAASLIYSTYLGGAGANALVAGGLGFGDDGFGVAVDTSSNAYIAGATSSTDFPTTANAFRTTTPTNNAKDAAFVARIDTTKSGAASLIYSTYLGGEALDAGLGIGLGPTSPNNVPLAYVTGVTESLAFPTVPAGAFQKNNPATAAGNSAAFVSLIDTGGTGSTSLTYSTFLGGSVNTTGVGIRVDAQGNAYVAGPTASLNFPVTAGAFEPVFPAGATGAGFLSKLNPGGNGAADLIYSTFFGGSGAGGNPDQVFAVAIDTATPANAYITGHTFSTAATFPVFPAGAFQKTLNGNSDAFIAKLTPIPTLVVSPAPGSTLAFGTVLIGTTSAAQTVTLTNNTNAAIAFTSAVVNGSPAAANTDYIVTNSCSGSIPFGAANTCTVSVTFKPTVVGAETATLRLTDSDSTSPQNILLTGTGANPTPAVMLAPTSLAFGNQQLNTTSTAQIVTLTNTGTGPLTINTIAASGDFAETSTGATACPISPATLAAGANCKISVTFTPTALGARAGTLTITDNAAGNPHTVPLTGTGTNTPDFTITATAPSPSPVKAGSPATFTVTVTPIGGFNSAVTIACVEPAALNLSTCTPTTSPITPNGAAVSTLVTVTTTAPGLMVPPPSVPTRPLRIWQIVPLVLAMILLFLLPTAKRLRLRLGMAAATLALLALAGCTGPGTPKKPGTTPGTYPLTVTGTAGATMHTVTPAPSVTVN
jgi:Abnormal spindle-like microcephaly-assoc'd, ASPM-SPD-2-Hydin/Beta-propeller repeat